MKNTGTLDTAGGNVYWESYFRKQSGSSLGLMIGLLDTQATHCICLKLKGSNPEMIKMKISYMKYFLAVIRVVVHNFRTVGEVRHELDSDSLTSAECQKSLVDSDLMAITFQWG